MIEEVSLRTLISPAIASKADRFSAGA